MNNLQLNIDAIQMYVDQAIKNLEKAKSISSCSINLAEDFVTHMLEDAISKCINPEWECYVNRTASSYQIVLRNYKKTDNYVTEAR